MLFGIMIVLLRAQHSRVLRSVERQVEFEKQIKSGVAYSDNPAVHFQDGMLYLSVDNYDDAAISFQQAIKLKPDWAQAHYKLGFVYCKLEQRGKAVEEYKILKDLDWEMAQKLAELINESNR